VNPVLFQQHAAFQPYSDRTCILHIVQVSNNNNEEKTLCYTSHRMPCNKFLDAQFFCHSVTYDNWHIMLSDTDML